MIKNGLGKNLTKSYLVIGKTHEDLLKLCFLLFSFAETGWNKINEETFYEPFYMSHLKFKNLFKVIMVTHATRQWRWYLKLELNFFVMKTVLKDWNRVYKSNTNLQLKL